MIRLIATETAYNEIHGTWIVLPYFLKKKIYIRNSLYGDSQRLHIIGFLHLISEDVSSKITIAKWLNVVKRASEKINDIHNDINAYVNTIKFD